MAALAAAMTAATTMFLTPAMMLVDVPTTAPVPGLITVLPLWLPVTGAITIAGSPVVSYPAVTGALDDLMPALPDIMVAMPGPVSRCPRIAAIQAWHCFIAYWRRRHIDGDIDLRLRSTHGTASDKNDGTKHRTNYLSN